MKYNPTQLKNGDWFVATSKSKGRLYGRRFSEPLTVEHCETTHTGHKFNKQSVTYSPELQAKQYALYASAEYYATQARAALFELSNISQELDSEEFSYGAAYFDNEEPFNDAQIMNPC